VINPNNFSSVLVDFRPHKNIFRIFTTTFWKKETSYDLNYLLRTVIRRFNNCSGWLSGTKWYKLPSWAYFGPFLTTFSVFRNFCPFSDIFGDFLLNKPSKESVGGGSLFFRRKGGSPPPPPQF
jgi:hypothetical protein